MNKVKVPGSAAVAAALLAVVISWFPYCGLAASGPADAGVAPLKVNRSWFFAEGTTGYGFEEYVCVQNPTDGDAVVQAVYMTPGGKGQSFGQQFVLKSYSRATINVGDVAPGTDVSIRVNSNRDVVCERSMYWGNRLEGHNSIGVTAPGRKWYLAEGCTDYGFEEYICLQNPGASSATVTITYNTSRGPVAKTPFAIGPGSRMTVAVNGDVPQEDVSATVTATAPIVAERSMYWDARRGGHASIGTDSPAREWFLAEGSTKWGFDTYVLVQNPGAKDASVEMTFLTASGPVRAPAQVVKAGSRKTFDARGFVGDADFSTSVNSDRDVICERSMYWDNGTGKAGHDTIGVKRAHETCFLAEGTTAYGFETFVLIANPNDKENEVAVSYMIPTDDVPIPSVPITVPPRSRVTIDVNADPYLKGKDVSVKLEGALPIAAERAMYWNGRGGGHDSIGHMEGFGRDAGKARRPSP